jgi:hypothetical protein
MEYARPQQHFVAPAKDCHQTVIEPHYPPPCRFSGTAKGFSMSIQKALLVGASALALVPSAAFAAPAKHIKKHAAHAVKKDAVAEELRALREQVADLSARVNVAEAAQRETVANVVNAQAQASTAASQAAAAQSSATAAATQAQAQAAQSKLAAAEAKPAKAIAPKWYDGTSISGRMYFNVSHIDQKSDGHDVAKSTAFDIKRFYLGVDHKFNDIFSANLTTDVSLISNQFSSAGTAAAAGGTAPTAFPKTVGETLYIKKAYLQASLNKAFNVRVGAADLPWVPFAEDLYGYRFVENTLIDRTSYGTSADWGVHAFGSFADGHITYAIAAIDGGGYRNPLRSKSVDIEGRVAVNYKGFTAAVGGYTGKRGGNTFNAFNPATLSGAVVQPIQTGTDIQTFHTAQRVDALLAYVGPKFRIGGEYFSAKNWNRVTVNSPIDDTAEGWSGWASYNVTKLVSVFGKYERTKPSKDLAPNITDRYYNVGINFEPVKIVDLAIVYKRERVTNGYFAPSNSNPSNAAFAVGGQNYGTYSEIGVWGQLRF